MWISAMIPIILIFFKSIIAFAMVDSTSISTTVSFNKFDKIKYECVFEIVNQIAEFIDQEGFDSNIYFDECFGRNRILIEVGKNFKSDISNNDRFLVSHYYSEVFDKEFYQDFNPYREQKYPEFKRVERAIFLRHLFWELCNIDKIRFSDNRDKVTKIHYGLDKYIVENSFALEKIIEFSKRFSNRGNNKNQTPSVKTSNVSKAYINRKTYLMIDHNTNLYKIGSSDEPKYRERTLQSEKPTIELLYVLEDNREKELHERFAQYRVRGEWFDLSNTFNEVKEAFNK